MAEDSWQSKVAMAAAPHLGIGAADSAAADLQDDMAIRQRGGTVLFTVFQYFTLGQG
jgi:hypothetical protein